MGLFQKFFPKSIATVLVASFSLTQFAWAEPLDYQKDELADEPAGLSSRALNQMQIEHLNLVQHQNDLLELQNIPQPSPIIKAPNAVPETYDGSGRLLGETLNGRMTYYVGYTDKGFSDLAQAIAFAKNGEGVQLAEGAYQISKTIKVAGKDLLIRSEGSRGSTIIQGVPGVFGFMQIDSASKISFENLTFKDFKVDGRYHVSRNGGVFYVAGNSTLKISNCALEDNAGDFGGAIFSSSSMVSVQNSLFLNNYGIGGSGAIRAVNTKLDISSSTFDHNTAGYYGAAAIGLSQTSTALIESSQFIGNVDRAKQWGESYGLEGTVVVTQGGGSATIRRSTFSKNGSSLEHTLRAVQTGAIVSDGAVISAMPIPAKTNKSTLVLNYSVDSVQKSKTYSLAEGANNIRLIEHNSAGEEILTDLGTVIRDTQGPVIEILTTLPAFTKENSITVQYKVDGITKSKKFQMMVDKKYTLIITEEDDVHNVSTQKLQIFHDATPPVLVLKSEIPALTNQTAFRVDYSVDGQDAFKIFYLNEGANPLSLTVTDRAGNSSSLALNTVTLDATNPVIALQSVTPSLTSQKTMTVNYTVDGVAKSKVFNLEEGNNSELEILEMDPAGNYTHLLLPTTILDTTAPTLGLLSDAYVYDPTYQLRYRIDDVSMATSTVTENVTLTRGLNTFTRQAQDSLGHARQMTWNIFLDQNAERGLSYDYDAIGNLTRQTTLNGEDITFTYDANKRPSTITYPGYPKTEFTYDNLGQMTRFRDSRGNTEYGYDIIGRLKFVILPNSQRMDYAYDSASRVTQLKYAGKTVDYVYDAAGNLTSVKEDGNTTTYAYNDAKNLISTVLPNGVRTGYTYDASGRLIKIRHEKADTSDLIAEFSYTLNASGERTQIIESRPSATRTVNYVYDAFKRLTRESDSLSGVTNYTYDKAGNRLSKEIIPVIVTTQTPRILTQYAYGVDNRLTSLTEKNYNASGVELLSRAESFVYDAAGNLRQRITPKKVYYYEFDSRNFLTRFNDGENEATYEYDGQGNRISKTVNGVKTSFFIDPASDVPQVLAEMDSLGNVTKTYVFGEDRLSSASGGTTKYFLQDGLGSSIGLMNSDGTVRESYSYDAFGNPQFQNLNQNFLYTGEQQDPETGLVYLRARYYDPTLGRFISRDPVFIGKQNESQSLNPFIYVQNNPVNWIDPLGLKVYEIAIQTEIELPDAQAGIKSYQTVYVDTDTGIVHSNHYTGTTNVGIKFPARFENFNVSELSSLNGMHTLTASGSTGSWLFPANIDYKVRIGIDENTDQIFLSGNHDAYPSYSIFVNGERAYYEHQSNNIFSLLGNGDDYDFSTVYDDHNNFGGWFPPGGGGGGGGWGGGWDGWGGGGSGGWDSGFGGYNFGLIGALSNSFPFDLGGVYMDKALSVIGQNIKNIHGVSYDPLTGQIIMLSDTGAGIPQIPVDYFLAALKAVYSNNPASPGVSIDPVIDGSGRPDLTQDQRVRFLGGIENTALGKAVYDADLLMKLIGLGSDNITKTAIRPNGENISESYISQRIPGFKDLFTLGADVTDLSILNRPNTDFRFWFVPKNMKLIKSAGGDAFVFEDSSVKLLTQTNFLSGGGPDDPRAVAYAQFFNDHFAELANLYPEFAELEKAMRAVGLAKFIKDNHIPVDLEWISKANLAPVATPATTPLASATKTVTIHSINQPYTITLYGGVDYSLFDGQNFQYLLDTASQVSGLRNATQSARGNDITQTWSVTMNGSTYNASAFSFAPTKKDGNFSWEGTDLVYSTSGGVPLIWQRYYDSFTAGSQTAMGNGWDYMPYALHFPVGKETRQFEPGGVLSSAVIYPIIYLSDKIGGGSILFKSAGVQPDGRIAYSSEDERMGAQVLLLNADGSYTLVRAGNKVNFFEDGRLSTITNKNLNTVEYVYDGAKKLIRLEDKNSTRKILVTYDANSRISKATGADGRSVSYVYDNVKADLIKVTQDWTGRFINLNYDADHRLLSAFDDINRKLFENTYDILGRRTSQTDYLGNKTIYNLNLLNQQSESINTVNGARVTATYDGRFRITSQKDALGNQTQYSYGNSLFGAESIKDALGNSQSFEYDTYGNVSSVADALGNKTRFYYQTDGFGKSQLALMIKPNSFGTGYQYDALGNLLNMREGVRLESIAPDGSLIVNVNSSLKTTFSYDSKGRLTQVKDANDNTTDYSYDDAGNVIQTKDGLQKNTQTTEYVTRGGIITNLVSKITDALGRAITFGYDAVRDLVTSVANAAGIIHYSYDSLGRQTGVTDAAGRSIQFIYNAKDQLTGVLEAGDLATTADDILVNFAYNALGQLVGIVNPILGVTQFVYDLAGRLTKLFIGESAKRFAMAGDIKISEVGEDTMDVTFNAGADVRRVKVLYKKKIDNVYQSLTVSNVVTGENQVRIQGLAGATDYDFQLEYQDQENDLSYSRQYSFKTKTPELPVIVSTTVQNVTNGTADIKINVSKEIQEAKIRYRIRGEVNNEIVWTQSVRDAKTDGITFNLEYLRSGLDYDAEITITDRFGVSSLAKAVTFKTTGTPLPFDTAIHATARFGQVVAVLTNQIFISVEHDNIANPFAEAYTTTIWDPQGNAVTGLTVQAITHAVVGRCAIITGLVPNTQYTYTIVVNSRSDILPVSGTFKTSAGGDTTAPLYTFTQVVPKDPTSVVFGLTFTEKLKMLEISLTDQVTQAVKKYHFFDIVASPATFFLLNGLDSGRAYTIRLVVMDTSGNYINHVPTSGGVPYVFTIPPLDETSPQATQNTLIERTATTASFHLVVSELLNKIKVRYRVIGTTVWAEQIVIPAALAFDISLAGLLSGQSYEYQYVLEDKSGNQSITEWAAI